MDTETDTRKLIPLDLNVQHAADYDYSFRTGISAEDRLSHLRGIREHLISSVNVVRTLGSELLSALGEWTVPNKLTFREFRGGDVYLLVRATHHYEKEHRYAMHLGVKLEMTDGERGRQTVPDDYDATLFIGEDRLEGETVLTHMIAIHLDTIFVRMGMAVRTVVRDGRGAAIIYRWSHDGQEYKVTLSYRVECEQPILAVVDKG